VLAERATYNEMGPDYVARFDNPTRRQLHQLEPLGIKVAIEPAAA
jgi:hypothetical protein